MNDFRYIFTLFALLLCSFLNGQKDSTWSVSIGANYTSEVIPSTGKSFSILGAEAKFKKNSNVFVPYTLQKTIHGIKGYQFGLAYYRKWNWGYTHTDFFYSPSLIFPKTVLRSNVNVTLFKVFEASAGVSTISYADRNSLLIVNLGGNYYYKAFMMTYNLRIPASGFLSHSIALRKYMRGENDYFQFNLSTGMDKEGLRLITDLPIKVYSVQFSMIKTIINKTQINVAFGLVKTIDESEGNEYFNYSIGLKRRI